MTTLVLFSDQMLRLDDHPALARASGPVVPVFVFDDTRGRPLGGASRWWLDRSLRSLAAALEEKGSPLVIKRGAVEKVIPDLARDVGADRVHMTRAYAPHHREAEKALLAALEEGSVTLKRFSGPLLFEPDQIETKAGKPYTVFSPFWRMCLSHDAPGRPLDAPASLEAPEGPSDTLSVDDLDLGPKPVDWAGGLRDAWCPGEAGAVDRLDEFLDQSVDDYDDARDFPARHATSFLSPHLRFGEISPRRIWWRVKDSAVTAKGSGGEHFLRELGWREFSYHLIFHFPHLETEPLREAFKAFPWTWEETDDFRRWTKGETGYPIVDAGMRQLWQTGYMHNRVRMIVSSFLVKDMLHHWRLGEEWFWDTLCDADYGNNIAGWQWAAGCGADAAPYFRIFNAVTQSEKFDPKGEYIRTYVPELEKMTDKHIHAPWEAPDRVLDDAGVRLGETYPDPMLDRKAARARALEAFERIKK